MVENPDTALVLRIFQKAFSLPQEKRAAFLEEACQGSEELRREVQKLFDDMAQTESTAFLETVTRDCGPNFDGLLSEGTEIGHYRILRPIGKGGMGEVYLAARSSDYRAEVAVKVARRDSPHALARFRRERQILAFLNHPNVCRLIDGGSLPPDGREYLVMEYVQGHLLHEHCERKEYDFPKRVELLVQLCRAIAACHERGILHRDLSPNNVMVTEDGAVKVMDYGLASFTKEHPESALLREGLTSQLGVGVTLPYAPPEQIDFDGTKLPDERSDIYMLGSLMYRLLCGQPPFDAMSRNDAVDAIRSREPVRPRKLKPTLPIDLETVCLKCLEKNPESRYATATELAKDLERFLRNEPVKARRASLLERANRWRQRNRVLSVLLLVLAIVTVVGLGSTLAAVSQALAFQEKSQDVLKTLATSLNESYLLNPSPYTFEQDFRDSLSSEMASDAERTLQSVREKPGKRPLLAAMHMQLASRSFKDNKTDEGETHYRESARLWRLALHDDPKDTQAARFLAFTLELYANSRSGEVLSVSDLEENGLLPGFSYDNETDQLAAAAIATHWGRRGQAFANIRQLAPSRDACESALLIWQRLLQVAPENVSYSRGLATVYAHRAEATENAGGNLAAAILDFDEARKHLLDLQAISPLNLSDLKLLATVTWRTAILNMRHGDWQKGRTLFEEAVSLGNACEKKANGSLDSIGFLTDIHWNCVESLRVTASDKDRLEFAERCRAQIVRALELKKSTVQDSAKLGACQFIIAMATNPKPPPEETGRLLTIACNNLTYVLKTDKVLRETWLAWRAKVQLALGDLRLTSLPRTSKEYYQAAWADAQEVLDTRSEVKESHNLTYFAKDRLQAIANEEAAAVPAQPTN